MAENSSRDWLDRELRDFAGTLPPGALLLDAGAGEQVYAAIFTHCRYESADFEKVDKVYLKPTYSCDLSAIPVEDRRFDAIVFTQVMEHIPDPGAVLRELRRVLKPGGRLFFTAPLWFEEHEVPYDFYRYTQFGLKRLFSEAGFDLLEMRGLDGYLASVSHQFLLMKRHLPRHPSGYGGGLHGLWAALAFRVFRVLLPSLRRLANASDRRFRYEAGGLPINYLAILTRPE